MNELIARHQNERIQTQYLNRLSEAGLRNRVKKYLRKDRSEWSNKDFTTHISRVLLEPGTSSHVLSPSSMDFPTGHRLYRARRIDSMEEISEASNVMHNPHAASVGRLNRKGEALLYTACEIPTALFEVGTEPGDLVSIAQFTTARQLTCTYLGGEPSAPHMPLSHKKKLGVINTFLSTLISQSDKPYGQPNYRETEFLVKEFFDLPPDIYSGWCYPSFARTNHTGLNVAFRPNIALDAVRLEVVMIAEVSEGKGDDLIIKFVRKLHPQSDGCLVIDESFMPTR